MEINIWVCFEQILSITIDSNRRFFNNLGKNEVLGEVIDERVYPNSNKSNFLNPNSFEFKNFSSSSTSANDPYIDSHGSPPWLPITFILTYELPQFAVYFQVNLGLLLH